MVQLNNFHKVKSVKCATCIKNGVEGGVVQEPYPHTLLQST